MGIVYVGSSYEKGDSTGGTMNKSKQFDMQVIACCTYPPGGF